MSDAIKEKIKNYVIGLGVDDVGFGAVSEYKSPLSPAIETIFPGAKTMIVMACQELSNCESNNKRIAMSGRLDVMEFMKSCNYKLARYLEKEFKFKAMATPLSYPLNMNKEARYGLVADFSQRHAAIAAGLGNWGRHNLVIHPRLGSRVLFTTVLCDAQLPPDPPVKEDLCIQCNICVEKCPGHALDEEGKTQVMKCLEYSQPFGIAANMGFWKRFIDSTPEEQKKMMSSPEYMSLYQSAFIGFQYNCFNCYMLCPVNR
ncbi:MAG TPA: 4Fe-4S binding protein [Smithellaceae bacterium]|nr:4Fe-4S binding protein [Smithellaceae bacterium]